MFRENDKYLLIARIVINILACIAAVGCVITGIVYMTKDLVKEGIIILFFGLLGCAVFWLFLRLLLSYLCDVKLIRNRLYEQGNENLEAFLGEKPLLKKKSFQRESVTEKKYNLSSKEFYEQEREKIAKMRELKYRMEEGLITEEEYDLQMKEIMK